MIKQKTRISLLALCIGLITVSCEKDTEIENITEPVMQSQQQEKNLSLEISQPEVTFLATPEQMETISENLRNMMINEAIEPSECGPTEFVAVQNAHLNPLLNDLYALFGPAQYASIFYLYSDLNFYSAYFDTSEDQYFGADGKYTNFVVKRQRELEKFWDMPNEILVKGQHTATLNDREKLADVYEIVGAGIETREQAYEAADQILYFNQFSDLLPESPFFAIDGFATTNNFIVIGDGIVQMLSETGIDSEIVWTGILSHEWAHQVQFNNYETWYPVGAENTRYTELEADFLSAYYMTHKRGATYNWKRVEQFFELFFNIGDCGFEEPGHHGTPLQRTEAAKLGYELANDAQKQGHILSTEELHEYFTSEIGSIIE